MQHATVKRQDDRFLVEAAELLASSLEYQDTLAALAQLSVRSLSDFCIIDVVDDSGEVRRIQVAHRDPVRAGLVAGMLEVPVPGAFHQLSQRVLASREPLLMKDVTEGVLESLERDPVQRDILRALEPQSLLAVPLVAHDGALGVALLGSSSRRYGAGDLALAEKLILLAGLELGNAIHYRNALLAVESRDRVLGAVAHDLRNPLHTIMMTASLLRDVPGSEAESSARAEVILKAADRMNGLIQDLLDVARIAGRHFALDCEDFNAAHAAREAFNLCAPDAAAKSHRMTLSVPPDAPEIHADRERLLRVLMNLIDNAIKFTPAGGVIEVGLITAPEWVRFTVADSGPGVSAEDLPHLFRPFWQARADSSRGAGLGLAIALGIVEAHGGTIGVESVPGRGSTFQFTVPVPKPRLEQNDRRGTSDLQDDGSGPRTGSSGEGSEDRS